METDLALLSSFHSSPGFINIHREIHPGGKKRERRERITVSFVKKKYRAVSRTSAFEEESW